MKRLLLVALVGGVCLAGRPVVGAPLCYEGRMTDGDGNTKRVIPVYLRPRVAGSFLGFPISEVEHQLRVALDNWTEETDANMRIYYAGVGTPSMDNDEDGRVLVYDTTNCGKCDTYACEVTLYNYEPANWRDREGSHVYFEDPSCPGNPGYATKGHIGEGTLVALFQHELGHSLGLEDEYTGGDCEQTPMVQSVMAQTATCAHGAYITIRDNHNLTAMYGRRHTAVTYKESSDHGLTWSAGSPNNLDHFAPVRLGTVGNSEHYRTKLLPSTTMYTQFAPPRLYKAESSDGTFSTIEPFQQQNTHDISSTALATSQRYAFVIRTGETDEVCSKSVTVAFTADGGDTWTVQNVMDHGAVITSSNEGATIAYDRSTGRYVVAWANSGYDIALTTFTASPPFTQGPVTPFGSGRTRDYPTIACGDRSSTGAENCMLAWLDSEVASTSMKWVRAHINTNGSFVPSGAPGTHGFYGWQPPGLAATGSSTHPFIVALKQNTTIYTWMFEASTSSWVNERNVVSLPTGIFAGSLGVHQNDGIHLNYVPWKYIPNE